jgi:hypothetical protein
VSPRVLDCRMGAMCTPQMDQLSRHVPGAPDLRLSREGARSRSQAMCHEWGLGETLFLLPLP